MGDPETTPKRYEVRPGDCDPRSRGFPRGCIPNRFSVTVGEVGAKGKRQPAALYRISGPAWGEWLDKVDRTARMICSALDQHAEDADGEIAVVDPRGEVLSVLSLRGVIRSPRRPPFIRVVRTKAGKAAGLP